LRRLAEILRRHDHILVARKGLERKTNDHSHGMPGLEHVRNAGCRQSDGQQTQRLEAMLAADGENIEDLDQRIGRCTDDPCPYTSMLVSYA